MARASTTQAWTAGHRCLPLLALATVALLTGLTTLRPERALAAGTTAVTTALAQPAAFVPDTDGHTDSAVLQYQLVQRSTVTIRVLDERGHVVATLDNGVREAGTNLVAWDGRGEDGAILPPGVYRMRVDAVPMAAQAGTAGSTTLPGSADSGGGVVVAGARAASVTIQQSAVAIRKISLSRPSLGRAGKNASVSASFRLSANASVAVAVVDAAGRPIRTLVTGRMTAGDHSVAWNGRDGAGHPVPEGAYAMEVAASGAGRPTATTRLPLTVDRTAPKVGVKTRASAKVAGRVVSIPIAITTGEAATVVVSVGRSSVRRMVGAGSTTITVAGRALGITAGPRARTVRLALSITDGTGNAVGRIITVAVAARTKQAPTTPPPAPTPPAPDPTPNPGAGTTYAWPVAGPVTSKFGIRWGRAHTGLDIAAPTMTPIHPAATGVVSFVGASDGYGNLVKVDHPNGSQTYYAHMARFGSYAVGETVAGTDVIGYVGCTGHCTGPHLHFEIRTGSPLVPRDPLPLLPQL